MRVPIQNGNVSKRDSIEQLAENARTGKLKPSLRTIPNPYVLLLVPEYYLQIPCYNNCQSNFQRCHLILMRKESEIQLMY